MQRQPMALHVAEPPGQACSCFLLRFSTDACTSWETERMIAAFGQGSIVPQAKRGVGNEKKK